MFQVKILCHKRSLKISKICCTNNNRMKPIEISEKPTFRQEKIIHSSNLRNLAIDCVLTISPLYPQSSPLAHFLAGAQQSVCLCGSWERILLPFLIVITISATTNVSNKGALIQSELQIHKQIKMQIQIQIQSILHPIGRWQTMTYAGTRSFGIFLV